jgi:hypothetical protein
MIFSAPDLSASK